MSDWHFELPRGSEVIFDGLTTHGFVDTCRDVSAVRLPSGWVIDVEWREELREYRVSLVRGSWRRGDAVEKTARAAGVAEVIEQVLAWAREYQAAELPVAAESV